jgi:hypothetical protein
VGHPELKEHGGEADEAAAGSEPNSGELGFRGRERAREAAGIKSRRRGRKIMSRRSRTLPPPAPEKAGDGRDRSGDMEATRGALGGLQV